MNTFGKCLVCVGVLVAGASAAWAQDSLTVQKKAQNKLLAYRAARTDAVRKLAERVKGLRIDSNTTVRDFVTESDTINTALMNDLVGFSEVGKPRYLEDGSCEVTLMIKLRTVIQSLTRIHRDHYKGDKWKGSEDFEKITTTYKDKVIKETGTGAPRPDPVDPLITPAAGQSTASFSGANDTARAYWGRHVTPQGRMLAERAARADAQRRLAERIKGVRITANTTVQDFVTESDQVHVDMRQFLVGAREVGRRYHDDELICEVVMEVKLRTVYMTINTWAKTHYKGKDVTKIQSLEEISRKATDVVIRETGTGVPPRRTLKNVPAAPAGQPGVAVVANTPPVWINRTLQATGYAAVETGDGVNPVQAELMAQRAAELDARRQLAEKIQGLLITSNTTVRNFMGTNDEIRTAMASYQMDASVLDDTRKVENGKAQVTVEIELARLWRMIVDFRQRYRIVIR